MSGSISVAEGPGWVRLSFTRPVLDTTTLEELSHLLDGQAERRSPSPLILSSDHPTIYLAGADLAEIAALDVTSSDRYAACGRSVMDRLDRHPRATIAAVNGSVSGGGFDLALSVDRVVAGPSATFAHPGVRRGLVTGWGGSVRLPTVVGKTAARRILLEAATITADGAASMGFAIPSEDDVELDAVALAKRLACLHDRRLRLWRLSRQVPRNCLWGRLASRAIID